MSELIGALLFDYTVRTVALGAAVLGVVSGVLGCYAVLRRQSLFGDALAHAALPGVAGAFIVFGSKSPLVLLAGAAVSGWLAALAVLGIVRGSRIKEDAALGTVLTVFFGFGIVLLTYIQGSGDASQSGLNQYLFGQAAALVGSDVLLTAALGALALGLVAVFYKELKLLSFDPLYGGSLGLPMGRLNVLLTGLITIAVVTGLQTVGVVLMAAMLVAPAVAARQWTDSLGRMLALSAAFGAFSGVVGALVSSFDARLPTGPLVILGMTLIFVVSLLFAPRRGVVWALMRRRANDRRLERERLLSGLSGLGADHTAVPTSAVAETLGATPQRARSRLQALERAGLVQAAGGGSWTLTEPGAVRAHVAHRGFETLRSGLARQLHVPEAEVHLREAELARSLPPEVFRELTAEQARAQADAEVEARARAGAEGSAR